MANFGAKSAMIADRYATALFELADKESQHATILADFDRLKNLRKTSSDLDHVLCSPLVERSQQATLLTKIGPLAGLSTLFVRFLDVLARARRLNYLDDIQVCYQEMLDKKAAIMRAIVYSAQPLNPNDQDKLKNTLAATLSAQIHLELRIKPELLGGLQVQIGSKMVDATLKGKLDRLALMMKGTI